MRQRKFHPPFIVKIEAGHEIEQTQIVSLSALLYCPVKAGEVWFSTRGIGHDEPPSATLELSHST